MDDFAFIGELSLDGEIRKANGVLPMVLRAKEKGLGAIFVPYQNAFEASVVKGIDILPARSIKEIVSHLDFGKLIAQGIPSDIQSNTKVIDAYLGVSEDE